MLVIPEAGCDIKSNGPASGAVEFPANLKGKRILLATESLGPINGVSRTTGSLIDYLRNNNVEIAVVAPEIKASKVKTSNMAQAKVRLHGWPLPYNPDLTVVYPFRIDRLFRKTFKPDLVYLASPASVGFQMLLQIRQLFVGPPVICNFQTDLSGYSEIIFPARMDTYAVWMLGMVQGFLFNAAAVQTVFYPCNDIRKYLQGTGVHSNKLVHLGRGVDTVMFDPERRDHDYRKELAPNGEIILICVSRLAPEKGFEFLARAAIKLADEGLPFKLVIVGGNRNPSVQAEVQHYFDPIKEKVVFTGFLTGVALARAYATADLFLHCSITETFGLVVLESMASGVPVVARDQGGPSEIVRHGKTGYLVPPQDLELFVSQVRTLCGDKETRDMFATASRTVALDTTWEKINNRAAWYIATAIQQHESQARQKKSERMRMFWPLRLIHALIDLVVHPLRERVRILFAIAIITGFWFIACIPLIFHGTFVFKAK